MKKILGSILLSTLLLANYYDIKLSKKSLFIKEPLLIELTFKTENIKEIDWIKFEPVKSLDYEIHTLKKETLKNGFKFYYLFFPLKSKKIKIDYNLTYKQAPFKEIQNKILGTGYEQTTPIEGKIYTVDVNSSIIDVKDAKAALYGNFFLQAKVDKNTKEAFEPIYLTLTLKGLGYKPNINDPLKNLNVLKVLKDKPVKKIKYTKDGAKIEYIFNYAIINDKNFSIPSISFKEFDYKEYKTLKTEPIQITILPPKIKPDNQNYPPPIQPVAKDVFNFLKYLLIFISGFFTALIVLIIIKRKFKLCSDIFFSSKKELLAILYLKYPSKFKKQKEALEQNKNIFKTKISILRSICGRKDKK